MVTLQAETGQGGAMSDSEIQTKSLAFASFLRDIVEATTTRQIHFRDQTKDGFVVPCRSLPDTPGVFSPYVDEPKGTSERVLVVRKPGPAPSAPRPDTNGVISAQAQTDYDASLKAWQRHGAMYDELFASRAVPDSQELVFGIGTLRVTDSDKDYARHLAIAPAEVHLDSTTGELSVRLIDRFEREVNWMPGNVRAAVVSEAAPLDDLVDAINLSEASEALDQLATSLGRSATVDEAATGPPAAGQIRLASSPCVLLRRKDSSALLKLLEELCNDIEAGGDLSEPFKILADTTYETTELEHGVDITVLPLDANSTQREVVERARTERHLVIQGPPGTGKTHTIANLLSSLMAEGRRVLVTAETDRALSEVQGKLPQGMQALALPLFNDRSSVGLDKSVNRILERTSGNSFEAVTSREIEHDLDRLETCTAEITDAEAALIRAAEIDREEHEIESHQLTLAGHQKYLDAKHEELKLIDTHLTETGHVSQGDATEFLDLRLQVTDLDRDLTKAAFPDNVMTGTEFANFVQEFNSALAQLPERQGRPHHDLEPLLDDIQDLVLLLERFGGASWLNIARSTLEYQSAREQAETAATNLNHGVTTLRGSEAHAARRVLDEFLEPAVLQLADTLESAIDLHSAATRAAQQTVEPIPVNATTDMSSAFAQIEQAADTLRRDTTGLLEEHAVNRLAGRTGRIPQLCNEALQLQPGTHLTPGLPVTVDENPQALHELLNQAENLKNYIDGGGTFARKIGTPRPVKDAAEFLAYVRVGGSPVDTATELDRAIEHLRVQQQLKVVTSWAEQHRMTIPSGMPVGTWLESFTLLDDQTAQLTASIELLQTLVRQGSSVANLSPSQLIDGIRKTLGDELVQRLTRLHDAYNELNDEIRISGSPVNNIDDARHARDALDARIQRDELAQLVPENWRAQIDPQRDEPDLLAQALHGCAIAAKIPDWARTSQLSAASLRELVARIQTDVRRTDVINRHDQTIQRLQRDLAGCVPKSPGGQLLEQAINDEDPTNYAHAANVINDERQRAGRAARLTELTARIERQHPGLPAAIDADIEEASRVAKNVEALQRLRDHRARLAELYGLVIPAEQAHQKLNRLHQERRQLESAIAENRCWLKAAERINSRRDLRSALSGLTNAISKVPKTRSAKSYSRRIRAVKEATEQAAAAIPCWIMPISRAVELIGYPTPDQRFDVIIIDEASQAWFTASFLYALANQVIVVGDDLQTSPADQIMTEADIRSVVNEHIPAHKIGNTVGPDLSLYDVGVNITGPDTMVDHFRCVPEIIAISNRLSYEPKGKTLLPARVRSGDSLEPIIHHRCHGQRSAEGSANPEEVEAIAQKILECHTDPRYSGLDFGVVVAATYPGAHIKQIQHRLLDLLGPSAMQDRRLDVGTAATFQGAERDVIFLSLVDHCSPGETLRSKPLEHTGKNRLFVHQLNVAVSRAKDQLHIFHSFGIDNLRDNDARRPLFEIEPDPSHELDDELAKCQSEFERDVVRAINTADPTLRILTQVEALGYSIDLVLETPSGNRLAVECDGDRWHTADEDMRRDLYRQRILERIGWRFERFLASEWYRDPNAITQQVLTAVKTKAKPATYTQPARPARTTAQAPQGSTTAPVPPSNPPQRDAITSDSKPPQPQKPKSVRPSSPAKKTATPATGERNRPMIPTKTSQQSGTPPPTTSRQDKQASNKELAQELRLLDKPQSGETWERAKRFVAEGYSPKDAARLA